MRLRTLILALTFLSGPAAQSLEAETPKSPPVARLLITLYEGEDVVCTLDRLMPEGFEAMGCDQLRKGDRSLIRASVSKEKGRLFVDARGERIAKDGETMIVSYPRSSVAFRTPVVVARSLRIDGGVEVETHRMEIQLTRLEDK